MNDAYADAADALADPLVDVGQFGEILLEAFPGDGISVSTLGDLLPSQTLSATDKTAARIDEMQFDLGEGPCWDAVKQGEPVFLSDLTSGAIDRWPAFLRAIATSPVSSLFAFPIIFGPLRLGAIDSYSRDSSRVPPEDTEALHRLGMALGRRVLEHALTESDHANDGYEPPRGDPFSRRSIHQATGVVIAQIGGTPEDAHLLIQGQAFSLHKSMVEVAADLLERRIRFLRSPVGITVEVSHVD
jgi:hypothetical protein